MKIFKILFILLCLVLVASSFSSAAPGNVRFTVHNLSSNDDSSQGLGHTLAAPPLRSFFSTTENQVCIFCHTPHNAKPAAPLWNKASSLTATTFKMYSSGSRSSAVRSASLPAGSLSLLCLSCHDGKTAINVLHNASGSTTTAAGYDAGNKVVDIGGTLSPLALQDFSWFGVASTNLGGTDADPYAGNDLTNDHPIGFSYTDAQLASSGRLYAKGSVNSAIRFFGPTTDRMECSTCHDPHINYDAGPGANPALKPFLVMSNVGSALCLSCHNK